MSLVLSGLPFPHQPAAFGQCSPPAQNFLLIAVDAGARRDTVFFGRGPSATTGVDTALCERELPPMPPAGVYDLRFANPPGRDTLQPPAGLGQGVLRDYRALVGPAQRDTLRVRLQPGSGGYPMTFSWSPASLTGVADSARLIDELGGVVLSVNMLSTSSAVLANPAVGSLLMILHGIPQIPAAPVLVSPPDGAAGQTVTPLLTWNAAAGATRYTVQVATDSLFAAPVVSDTAVATPSRAVSGLLPSATYFWRVRGASGAGNGPWSPVWRFTTVMLPSAPALVSPANGASGVVPGSFLVWHAVAQANAYRIQLAADSLFASPLINDPSVPDTVRTAAGLGGSTKYFWRVAARNGAGDSPWSAVRSFTTAGSITAPYAINAGWNMISLPLDVADARTTVVFPTATSPAFRFGVSGYAPEEILAEGVGYWLKFPAAQTVSITGRARALDTMHVVAGWNLIGTVSVPVDTGTVRKVPAGVLTSPYYEYSGSYTAVGTLQPGKSYWVKATSAGILVIAPPPPAPSVRRGFPDNAGRR